ncbi:hypothetical protein [Hymenobacter koreensis]|uniref:Uncharacterized protein n=1 Tax=Hymenobacter koreensis TaxID=1084523 RepID=A0ABP8IZE9_9BACT
MHVQLIPVLEVSHPSPALVPFAPGLPFYRAATMELNHLKKVVADHLQGYIKGEYGADGIGSLWGGYVLRIDNTNVLFPQCCGELSDIIFWKHVALKNQNAYYNGHPGPVASFSEHEVILHCTDSYESFVPDTAAVTRVPKTALAAAYTQAVQELEVLERLITQIGQHLAMPINNLAHLLIYRNAEMPAELP